MLILLLFAFLAGFVTVLSPCILPVLPALLAAGAGKGRLRPIGIVLGLILSFTFFTLMLTALVKLTGVSADLLRYVAIALIAGFGVLMIFPSLGERFAKSTAGIASLGQGVEMQSRALGSGLYSGMMLGSALGLVWTPCAGPILAAITTLVATSSATFDALLITLAYGLGAALPMFAIIYGGKRMIDSSHKLSRHTEAIRRGFGILMIAAAMAIAMHYDVVLQQAAVEYLPFLNLDDNVLVRHELQKLREKSAPSNKQFILPAASSDAGQQLQGQAADALPEIAPAPELIGIVDWVNTPPLNLKQLRGKVVLIDFWTYSCINCIRTFPYLKAWDAKYKDRGLVIIGVHTPEFEFEKKSDNVKQAVERFGLLYPIAIDSHFETWQNYNNQYWPAHYLIDQRGIVRSFHFGEGAYMETENEIRNLLGLSALTGSEEAKAHHFLTPETYLGNLRAGSYLAENDVKPGEKTYAYRGELGSDQVGLRGKWLVSPEKITAQGDSILDLNFIATRVYVVMESSELQHVKVLLDDQPLPKQNATSDMNEFEEISVHEPRKYDVLNLHGNYSRHKLSLHVPAGVSLYAFTFGDEA